MCAPLDWTRRAPGESGSPEKVVFMAGNSQSARATACNRKSFTDSLGEAAASVADDSARNACSKVQSTERSTMNCGTVALLSVIARTSARRIGDIPADAGLVNDALSSV